MSEVKAGPETITPERQIAAQQIGAVFNSIHEFVRTLQHKNAEGEMLISKQLEFAHARIDEAAMWAIKHILTFGPPPLPAAANDKAPAPAAETPAPVPLATPESNVKEAIAVLETDGAPALPQTDGGTPTEAV